MFNHIDYGNSVFRGLPKKKKIYLIQNAAAHVITST